MTRDLITRNLQDASGNLGVQSVVVNQNGLRSFVDAQTSQPVNRNLNADAYALNNTPLDNSFQLDAQNYNVSKALFEQPGVPENLSNLMGSITSVTAKSEGVSSNQLFQNGVPADALLENVNFFRTAHSQIGYNDGDSSPPYLNNLMLGVKILNQTS